MKSPWNHHEVIHLPSFHWDTKATLRGQVLAATALPKDARLPWHPGDVSTKPLENGDVKQQVYEGFYGIYHWFMGFYGIYHWFITDLW